MTEQETIEKLLTGAGLEWEISGGSDADYIELEILKSTISVPHGYVKFVFDKYGSLVTVFGLADGSNV